MFEPPTGRCPHCGADVFLEQGSCLACGQPFCPRCGATVGEADGLCEACGLLLEFACPDCAFTLLTQASECPNCGRSFVRVCPRCNARVFGEVTACDACGQAFDLAGRPSGEVFGVGGVLVMVRCPTCRAEFPLARGFCQACRHRICTRCALVLVHEENACPRCGQVAAPAPTFACPQCATRLPAGSSECGVCGVSLCPQCQHVVDADATRCFACGAHFSLTCDHCGGEVSAADVTCPHCGERFEEEV